MSEPLTKADLTSALETTRQEILVATRQDLHDALATQTEVIKHELNDRFDHWEKRAITREEKAHKEMTQGFAEIIESVNNHADERFEEVHESLKEIKDDLGGLRKDMNGRFETIGQRHNDLAVVAGHPEFKVA